MKPIAWLSIIFVMLVIADMVSTLLLGPLVPYLEANPLYQYIGLGGIFLINMLYIWLVYYWYNKSNSSNTHFMIILILVTVCISRVFVVVNNSQLVIEPPSIEAAMAVSNGEKWSTIWDNLYTSLMPYIISLLSFTLFKVDHKIEAR